MPCYLYHHVAYKQKVKKSEAVARVFYVEDHNMKTLICIGHRIWSSYLSVIHLEHVSFPYVFKELHSTCRKKNVEFFK